MRNALRHAAITLAIPIMLAGSFVTTAHADVPIDSLRAEAEVLFNQGLALVDQAKQDGDITKYEAARVKFLAAYKVVHRPSVAFNLAITEQKTGHIADALNHFRDALRDRDVAEVLDGPHLADANHRIEDLSHHCGQARIKAPSGSAILVDGIEWTDRTPLTETIAISPGRHLIEARIENSPVRVEVQGVPGKTSVVTFIAGESTGHVVDEGAPGSEDAPHTFWTTKNEVGLGLISVGIVSAVVGTVFGIAAGSKTTDATNIRNGFSNPTGACAAASPPSSCSQLNSLKSSHDTDRTLEGTFLGAGGALVIGGLAALIWPHSREGSTDARITPTFAPGRVGVDAQFHF